MTYYDSPQLGLFIYDGYEMGKHHPGRYSNFGYFVGCEVCYYGEELRFSSRYHSNSDGGI